mmetsp:Transcript_21990/g.65950  ORF Transcript_21990/g.65950 Transcript_21990/m.65950 type:complete len:552 (-) Transcript_21990:47-1702(-)
MRLSSILSIAALAKRARAMSALAVSSTKPTLVWLRDELRVHDNALLAAAASRGADAVPVFCVDDSIYAASAKSASGSSLKAGAKRTKFVLESCADLRASLAAKGSGLVVRRGRPADVLKALSDELGGAAVVCSEGACSEELAAEAEVTRALGGLSRVWEGTLYHRDDLDEADHRDQFTAWRTKVEKAETPVRGDCFPPGAALPPPPAAAAAWFAEPLPALADLGYAEADAVVDTRGDFFAPSGGETAALARLERYVWREDRLKDYFDTRNGMIGQGYSTKLAPWLARGCVSPRRVARECARYERERVANKSTYWVKFELTWRDFFAFYARRHGEALFHSYGVLGAGERPKWRVDPAALAAWKAGRTGAPLVDANMRELAATGFMSNRGRQNAASYLVHDLGLDWRLGAEHFEEHLVDYTPEANWGNWHAAAGLAGGRVNRFNILKQSRDYDPDGEYVRLWLPELARVPAPQCFEPHKLSPADRGRLGCDDYPRPLRTMGYDGKGKGGGGRGGRGAKGGKGGGRGKGGERDRVQRKRREKNRVQNAYNDEAL